MRMGLAPPFRKGEGQGEGLLRRARVRWYQTPHLNPLPCFRGEAGKQDAVLSAWPFIKVPKDAPYSLLLKRRFHTGVC